MRRGARHASDASKQYPAQTDGRTVSGMQAWRGSPPGGFFFCGYGFAVLSCSKKQFSNNNWFGKSFRLQATCHGSRPHVTAAGGGKVTARRAQNQQRSQGQQPAGAARQSQSQIFSPSRQQSHKRTQNKRKPQGMWQKRGTMTFDVNRSKSFWHTPIFLIRQTNRCRKK